MHLHAHQTIVCMQKALWELHMEDAIACTSNNCMHAESIVRIGHRTLACDAHYAVFGMHITIEWYAICL